MKNLIYTVESGITTVANVAMSVGRIFRRYGCAVNASGANVILARPGYYNVDVSLSVTNDTAAPVTIQFTLEENGAAVDGGEATVTIPATESETLSFASTVRVFCGVNKTLQVVPNVAGVTVDNFAVRVTEV